MTASQEQPRVADPTAARSAGVCKIGDQDVQLHVRGGILVMPDDKLSLLLQLIAPAAGPGDDEGADRFLGLPTPNVVVLADLPRFTYMVYAELFGKAVLYVVFASNKKS